MDIINFRGRWLLASASAMAASLASPAWTQAPNLSTTNSSDQATANAQTAAQPSPEAAATSSPGRDAGSAQDIVVTAQFRSQRLQDVPLAITAVDNRLLEARSQNNLAQIAKQAPSVVIIPAGGAFGPSIGAAVRGVGQFDFNPAYEPGVGLYIDDVYYATLTGSLFDLLDLDRAEILRGPQGTLAGRNSEGGAVKLYSKKPDMVDSGYVDASYGNYKSLSLRGSGNFKLTDTLFARFSGVFKRQDGFVSLVDYGCAQPGNPENIAATRGAGDCTVAKLGEIDYKALRAQLRWNPSDVLDVTLATDYTYQKQTNAPEVLTISTNPRYICGRRCTYADFRTPAYNFPYQNEFKGGGASLNGIVTLNDHLALTSITAYRAYRTSFGTDDDFSPGTEVTLGNPAIRREAGGFDRLKFHFFSQELRLNGDLLDNAIQYTVGGFYSTQKTTYYTIQDIGYIVPGAYLTFLGNDPVNANSKAVFATAIVHPGIEGLTFTGGVRYTKEHKDYTFLRRNPNGSTLSGLAGAFGLGALDGLKSNYNGDRVDYRASVDYRFSPAILVYGTISTGFKGGGTSARPFTAQQALKGTFRPETLTNFEIGAKTDLLDRHLRVNVSAYIDNYKDIQLPLADCSAYGGGPCGVVANAGNARNKGVEVEVSATPLPGLNIDGSMSYLRSRFTKLSSSLGSNYVSTDPASFSPAWQGSGGIQYRTELGGNGSITPRVDFNFNDRQFTGRALGYPYYLPAYTLMNARLTWRNAKNDLEIAGAVTNFTNKYYYNAIFSAVVAFSGNAYQQIGRPREYRISVKKSF